MNPPTHLENSVTQAGPEPRTDEGEPLGRETSLPEGKGNDKPSFSTSATPLLNSAEPLELDHKEASTFLRALGRGFDGDVVRMRTFKPDGFPDKHNLDRHIALKWQRELGQGVYIPINRGGDSDADITECVALFNEWDDRPKDEQLFAWKDLGLPEPSIQVDSGNKSIHSYWVFENPIDKDTWRDLQERLVLLGDSDPALKNPSRVMRLPGCWNFSKKTGERLGMTTVVHTSDTLINPVEMDRLLPDRVAVKRNDEIRNYQRPATGWEPRPYEEVLKALDRIPPRLPDTGTYHEYRNALWGLQCALDEIGRNPAEAADLFATHSPEWRNVYQCAQYPHQRAWAGWFWKVAATHGYDLSRPKKQQPRMPSLPAGKDIRDLTVDDLLGPIEDDKLRNPRADRLRLLMEVVYKPRFNLLTSEYEVESGEYVDNGWLDSLYLRLAEEHQVSINDKRAKDAFIYAARSNSYHPVRDYLNGLPLAAQPISDDDWELLALKVFKASDPNANKYLQRQLIAAIARIKEPGCKVDTALVTHGGQGIQKSEFWAVMGGPWFSDALGTLSNMKDDQILLHGAWIHEWGEIDRVVGKKESETVKHFITIREDRVRPPYGRKVETWKRQSIFVGTTNRDDFIKDHTGNRRYPIFTAEEVDIEWVRANRDAIWARALAEYEKGERWWYDKEETEIINATAQGYAADDQFVEALEPHVEHLLEANIPTLCMTIRGWDKFIDDSGMRKKIGYALNRLGFVRDPNDKRTITVPTRGSMRVCFFHRDTSAKGGQDQ